jgi:predicted nucleic acid-binding protein
MEVPAGARNHTGTAHLRRLLTSFGWLPLNAVTDFEVAAKVYRSCRDAGITPRGLIDCMVASIAMRTGSELLTADRDFTAMASVVPLRLAR